MSGSINHSTKLLYKIILQGYYDDEDEFGEILGWYLQARFGDINRIKTSEIIQSLKDFQLIPDYRAANEEGLGDKMGSGDDPSMLLPSGTSTSGIPGTPTSSYSVTSSNSVLSENDHTWVAELLSSSTSNDQDYGMYSGAASAKRHAVKAHIKHVLSLPESIRIPIEAFEYWYEYRGTARPMAISLFIAGIHRKAHDVLI